MGVESVFGVNAGKVWQTLHKGEKSVAQISKETKLNSNEVYAALGWLGREGKLIVTKKNTGTAYKVC